MKKRVFLIILDSLGAGAQPDAAQWGDAGVSTLRSISKSPRFYIPNLIKLGMGNIAGLDYLGRTASPKAACARLTEMSSGKDTTIGHWELAGLYSSRPLPTFPNGFPIELLSEFSRRVGRGWLCNKPFSGTEVIKVYGEEHMRTGSLIVYTSADSVFQIAAHEDVVPLDELYSCCRTARELLRGEYGVGRVIARPFIGDAPNYTRTTNRHDFSLEPPGQTILDAVSEAGMDCIAVGKIKDIFAGKGITESVMTHGNAEGMQVTLDLARRDFNGLCFINLVDFDMLYGHRQDVDGYAGALTEFDGWLQDFLPLLGKDDALIITADHGCDPADNSTDHTREYVPFLAYGDGIPPVNLGTRGCFSDVAATIACWLGVSLETRGKAMEPIIETGSSCQDHSTIDSAGLVAHAQQAMQRSYSPYSRCKVGAALMAADGRVFTGCNIENAAFSPTNCAERTAFFKAVSEGATSFDAIAVVGGRDGEIDGVFPPCGVCLQVMMEFCDPQTFQVILGKKDGFEEYSLAQLLPQGFGPSNV